jgi:hypothetical protein
MDPIKLHQYRSKLLEMIPGNGTTIGNTTLRSRFENAFKKDGVTEDDYWEVRQILLNEGLIERGRGKEVLFGSRRSIPSKM